TASLRKGELLRSWRSVSAGCKTVLYGTFRSPKLASAIGGLQKRPIWNVSQPKAAREAAGGSGSPFLSDAVARPEPGSGASGLAQERRDVDVVVGDFERLAVGLADRGAAIARRGTAARLLARRARPGAAVVEAGRDDGDADLVGEIVVEHRAED